MDPFDPELWFHRRAAHYVEAQLLYHLNSCGFFAHLEKEGPSSVEELATKLSLDPKALGAVLEFIAGVDSILCRSESGAYALTLQGRAVLERYSRRSKDGTQFNIFDVRVGAYGPVWQGLGDMLRGEVQYGDGLHRAGEVAAEGVYKVGAKMAPGLVRLLEELKPQFEVELGVTTGLLEAMALHLPARHRIGLDRSATALKEAGRRAVASGATEIAWMNADLFNVSDWADRLPCEGVGVFFSVHFHEFMAQGEEAVQGLLRDMGSRFPGAYVVALEQAAENESGDSEAVCLYAQSNRLIHHLIGNGRILSQAEWVALFEGSGCKVERVESLNYLGYKAYVVELGQ